jgi:multicomponent Na+:H+ antiporter subunit F
MILSTFIVVLVLPLLGVAVVLTFVRLMRGSTMPDRVVALDLLATLGIGVIAACAIWFDQPALLDVASVIALIAFMGTVSFAYYIERSPR